MGDTYINKAGLGFPSLFLWVVGLKKLRVIDDYESFAFGFFSDAICIAVEFFALGSGLEAFIHSFIHSFSEHRSCRVMEGRA